jgi:hypothetical protein
MIIPANPKRGRPEVRVRSPNPKQKLLRLSAALVTDMKLKHGRFVSLALDEKRDLLRLRFWVGASTQHHRISKEGKDGLVVWANAALFAFLPNGRYAAEIKGRTATIRLPLGTGREFLRTDTGKALMRAAKR